MTSQPADEYFRSLEAARTQALVERKVDLARGLHAPEYQLITPAGRAFDLEGYLKVIADGDLAYTRWEIGEMQVRASAAMAIVRYRARIEFASGRAVNLWHTDSYELRGQSWLAVWSQATEIKG